MKDVSSTVEKGKKRVCGGPGHSVGLAVGRNGLMNAIFSVRNELRR